MGEKVTKAVILAAGEGRRLRPLTQETPKAMLPVGGVPLLERLVRYLAAQGVGEIAINLHHAPGIVVHYFGDGAAWGVRLTYSYEPRILGTAGAVRKLQDFLTETFFVVYGDLLTEVDLARVAASHREHRAVGTIVLYRVADPWERSVVELDRQGRVLRFVEKPPRELGSSGLANAGIYVLEPE
ncbi:MAG: nucleotidyltransferase family protein, partial [Chloroflexi bacterium]|nr:nucleotidyltransferase family protein [Chloroflexota bacterium]